MQGAEFFTSWATISFPRRANSNAASLVKNVHAWNSDIAVGALPKRWLYPTTTTFCGKLRNYRSAVLHIAWQCGQDEKLSHAYQLGQKGTEKENPLCFRMDLHSLWTMYRLHRSAKTCTVSCNYVTLPSEFWLWLSPENALSVLGFWTKYLYAFLISHTGITLRSSIPPWIDHSNNVQWAEA